MAFADAGFAAEIRYRRPAMRSALTMPAGRHKQGMHLIPKKGASQKNAKNSDQYRLIWPC
ncbi:hypothetical protein [Bradyrhizobium sp. Ai1a-2]|uniref:hypothetical protein n=1 Tax=Bradyrhizobium sp. Ai1a-2 TaxID=196490 RepID=UPI001269673E|nr:hypothetical protein [Bradyrhizobium sp. Ai1a-2]